jgi:hypothetical protein
MNFGEKFLSNFNKSRKNDLEMSKIEDYINNTADVVDVDYDPIQHNITMSGVDALAAAVKKMQMQQEINVDIPELEMENVKSKPVVYPWSSMPPGFNQDEISDILRTKNIARALFEQTQVAIPDDINYASTYQYFVAGGVFASAFLGTAPKDIDVFILDDQKTIDRFKYFLESLTENGYVVTEKSKYAKDFTVYEIEIPTCTKVQYIFTKKKTREEVLADFDFLHCKVSYQDGKLYISPDTYRAIMHKCLVPTEHALKRPLGISNKRLSRFTNDGWKMIETPVNINMEKEANPEILKIDMESFREDEKKIF